MDTSSETQVGVYSSLDTVVDGTIGFGCVVESKMTDLHGYVNQIAELLIGTVDKGQVINHMRDGLDDLYECVLTHVRDLAVGIHHLQARGD